MTCKVRDNKFKVLFKVLFPVRTQNSKRERERERPNGCTAGFAAWDLITGTHQGDNSWNISQYCAELRTKCSFGSTYPVYLKAEVVSWVCLAFCCCEGEVLCQKSVDIWGIDCLPEFPNII